MTAQEAQRIEMSIAMEEKLVKLQRDLDAGVIELTRLADVKVWYYWNDVFIFLMHTTKAKQILNDAYLRGKFRWMIERHFCSIFSCVSFSTFWELH